MPNGKVYRPYRLPGKYACITCRNLLDADAFYKDCTRYNGCSSRCKTCEALRDRSERERQVQRDSTIEHGTNTFSSKSQSTGRWSASKIKKRVDEIKSTA